MLWSFDGSGYDTALRVFKGQWLGRHAAHYLGRERELERRRLERERQLGREPEQVG
jgi:hypothetical protein